MRFRALVLAAVLAACACWAWAGAAGAQPAGGDSPTADGPADGPAPEEPAPSPEAPSPSPDAPHLRSPRLAGDAPPEFVWEGFLGRIRESVLATLREQVEEAMRREDYAEAARCRERMIRADVHFAAVWLYVQGGMYEQAVQELQRILGDAPADRTGHPGPGGPRADRLAGPGSAPPIGSSGSPGGGPPGRRPGPEVLFQVPVRVRGDGLFRVQSPSGETAYLRGGHLGRRADGVLVMQGWVGGESGGGWGGALPLLPELHLPDDMTRILVQPDGAVAVRSREGDTRLVGRIELALFPSPSSLVPGGRWEGLDLLYTAGDAGLPASYTPGPGSPAGVIGYGGE